MAQPPPQPLFMKFNSCQSGGGGGDINVYRRVEGALVEGALPWIRWVHIRSAGECGKGLFASRDFQPGETIGRYVGHVMGRAAREGEVDGPTDLAARWMGRTVTGDAITNVNGFYIDGRRPVQSNDEQIQLVGEIVLEQPNWAWPGAYIHICNDPRGSSRTANVTITELGFAEAAEFIPRDAELLWEYGDKYWEEEDRLGTRDLPFNVQDSDSE
jgi:hypothetical protein